MGFGEAITSCFSQYIGFSGRACRSEYWYFALLVFLINIVIGIIGSDILTALVALALFLPSISVGVRRLHDIDKSGWWILLALIPIIGTLIILFFAVLKSTPGSNEYGPNPLGE